MRDRSKIGVIILAAGSSSRLGYPKQLVEFKGIPLLQHSIDVTESLEFETKILVLGAKEDEINKKINRRNFEVVINENWEEGMSTSIRKGLSEALKLEKELEHILMLLSDQPFVNKEKIQELINVQLETKKQATFSEYAGDIGVPAIFSREIFSDLKKLKGDQGAKKLINDKNFQFGTVKFENGNFDVDTTADVEFLKQMEEKMQVTIKYFGIIAETVGKKEEILEVAQGMSVTELKDRQIKTYQIPEAESVQLAVNQNLNTEVELKEGDEVAFLPPFAGG